MKARKTNARIKAVINHSKVFATSMTLAFRPVFFGFIFSLSSRLIMVNSAQEAGLFAGYLQRSGQRSLSPYLGSKTLLQLKEPLALKRFEQS